MSLSDLSALGSFISSIAVVVSLVFLSLQIRQSNQNQRSLMQQGRTNRRIDLLLRRTDPHLAGIILRAAAGDRTLEPAQLLTYAMIVQASFEGYEDTFLQHKAGTMDAYSWETERVSMRNYCTGAAVRVVWRRFRQNFSGEFRDMVDAEMQQAKVVKPSNLSESWSKAITEELAQAPA